MRQDSSALFRENGVRTRLTDPTTISTAAKLMREAGYTELAMWRHFIDAFAVDLDALSLIMKELFSSAGAKGAPRITSSQASERSQQLRAA
ncbi:MAG: hypothetical protein JO172_15500 [Hyphomicrobiales bacterium]|nr:hypothetical protein [Hyphomicrobiales bacterium]